MLHCLLCFILCAVACLAGPGQGSGGTRAVITSTRSTARAAAAASAGVVRPGVASRVSSACLLESQALLCLVTACGICVWLCDM